MLCRSSTVFVAHTCTAGLGKTAQTLVFFAAVAAGHSGLPAMLHGPAASAAASAHSGGSSCRPMGTSSPVATGNALVAWGGDPLPGKGPFLVVCPLATVDHWRREVTAWTFGLSPVVLHGNEASASVIRRYELGGRSLSLLRHNVFIVPHTSVGAWAGFLNHVPWQVCHIVCACADHFDSIAWLAAGAGCR